MLHDNNLSPLRRELDYDIHHESITNQIDQNMQQRDRMIDELQTLVVIPEQEEANNDEDEDIVRLLPNSNNDDGEDSASSGEILHFEQ